MFSWISWSIPMAWVRAMTAEIVGGLDFDADVVQRTRLTQAGEEHQLQRRIGDRKVGIAFPDLCRGVWNNLV